MQRVRRKSSNSLGVDLMIRPRNAFLRDDPTSYCQENYLRPLFSPARRFILAFKRVSAEYFALLKASRVRIAGQ